MLCVSANVNCCWCVFPIGGTTGWNWPDHVLVAVHQQHFVSLFVKCLFNQLSWNPPFALLLVLISPESTRVHTLWRIAQLNQLHQRPVCRNKHGCLYHVYSLVQVMNMEHTWSLSINLSDPPSIPSESFLRWLILLQVQHCFCGEHFPKETVCYSMIVTHVHDKPTFTG